MAVTAYSVLLDTLVSQAVPGMNVLVGAKQGDFVARVFTASYDAGPEDLTGAFERVISVADQIKQTATLEPGKNLVILLMSPT